jgi:hypothetical protein
MVANLYRAFYGLDQLPGSNVTFVFPDATTATNSSEVAASEGDTFTVTAVASTPLSAELLEGYPSDSLVIDSRVLDPNIPILDDSAPDAGRDDPLDAATPPVSSTPNTTTEAAAESPPAAQPSLQDGDNGSPNAAAEFAPAAPQPQPASVPANLSGTWHAVDNDDWNHGQSNSVVSVSKAMSRIKKTYGRPISDRIDRNSSRILGIAGFTTLAAVGLAIATPVVGAIGLGAFAWGAAALAAKATVGLIGFGAAGKLLRSSLRVFEGEKATTQRQQADAYDAQRQQISLELIQSNADKYGNELRAQLGLPSRLPAPVVAAAQTAPAPVAAPAREPVAKQTVVEQSAPAPVAAPPAPVAAPPAPVAAPPAPVAAPPAPVATAAPAREPVAVEQPAPVVVEQSAPEPAVATAPAPVMIKPIWGDSASYELYGIDTKSNLNFSQNTSENPSFNGLSNENIKLSLNYEFSLDTAALQRLGLTQFQRTN